MNARTLVYRNVTLAVPLVVFGFAQSGCTNSDPEPDPNATAYAASGGIPPQGAPESGEAFSPQLPQQPADLGGAQGTQIPSDSAPRSESVIGLESRAAETNPGGDAGTPLTIAGAEAVADPTPKFELRADLSPEQLLKVVSGADQDMQTILSGRSGITDPREARARLIDIVRMKLEASRRLSKHADATAEAHSEAARGELQSLSHLASFGDVKV
ncbi:unnamed protein product, partial [marine sediment metagenome]